MTQTSGGWKVFCCRAKSRRGGTGLQCWGGFTHTMNGETRTAVLTGLPGHSLTNSRQRTWTKYKTLRERMDCYISNQVKSFCHLPWREGWNAWFKHLTPVQIGHIISCPPRLNYVWNAFALPQDHFFLERNSIEPYNTIIWKHKWRTTTFKAIAETCGEPCQCALDWLSGP